MTKEAKEETTKRVALSERRREKKFFEIGLFVAIIVHMGVLVFPLWLLRRDRTLEFYEQKKIIYVIKRVKPEVKQQPKKIKKSLKKVKRIAIPDPTPDEPEPIREPEPEPEPEPIPEDAEVIFGMPTGPPALQAVRAGVAGVTPPVKTHHVEPVYPLLAKRANVGGTVVLEIIVDQRGTVSDIKMIKGIGTMGLDEEAIRAVKQWIYKPGSLNQRSIPVQMIIKVRFEIEPS
jgi:TonB family protein